MCAEAFASGVITKQICFYVLWESGFVNYFTSLMISMGEIKLVPVPGFNNAVQTGLI